jgi:putative tryptophan/tyrosine transport system substrate-binding protein
VPRPHDQANRTTEGLGNDACYGVGMKNRRKLVVTLGAGSLLAPFAALAQSQGKVWRVGFLTLRSRPDSFDAGVFGAFRAGMRELGYVEGNNLVIEWRFADGKPELLARLAAELVQLNVDVIVTAASQPTGAAQKATATIPIVIGSAGDPVASGFVQSLKRQGGNITGVSENALDIVAKLLEILARIRPKLSLVAVLTNPDNAAVATRLKVIQDAAQSIEVATLSTEARNAKEIGDAFALMALKKAEAVIAQLDPVFLQQWRLIADLALKYRLPSTAGAGEYPQAGGLLWIAAIASFRLRWSRCFSVARHLRPNNVGNIIVQRLLTPDSDAELGALASVCMWRIRETNEEFHGEELRVRFLPSVHHAFRIADNRTGQRAIVISREGNLRTAGGKQLRISYPP